MMGRRHVAFGAVCALGVTAACAQVFDVIYVPDILLAISQASGYAIVPDFDKRSSIATRSFPAITVPLHHLTVWLHRCIYHLTRRSHNPPSRLGMPRRRISSVAGSTQLARIVGGSSRPWRDAHRGLSHSLVTAVLSALLAGVLSWLHPVLAALIILFGVLLFSVAVCRAAWGIFIVILYSLSSMLYFGLYEALAHLSDSAVLWGLAVLVGLVSHDLSDSCTKKGVALLAPYSWKMYRSPVSFSTNDVFERRYLPWIFGALAGYFLWILISVWWPQALPSVLRLIVG